MLPRAAALLAVVATGRGGAPLVDAAAVKVGSLRAGVSWDGAALAPDPGVARRPARPAPLRRLDLTNVDSVEAAATDLVVDGDHQALGTDVGRRLAAIAGLVPPEDPANPGIALPGWTHHLDLTTLVVRPGRRHRRLPP